MADTPPILTAVKGLLAAALLLLAACTPLPDTIAYADPDTRASVQPIYVTSGRLPSTQSLDQQRDRNPNVRFARYDVSIPPTHALGQIEWPRDTPDTATDFAVVGARDFGTDSAFIRAIAEKPGDDVVVFVHGFNNTPSEALYRFAQIGHDFGIKAPRILFAWPSSGSARGYIYDRDSVLFSRDPLADLLTDLGRRTNKSIRLIAHSMGAQLTMEALRQLAITGRRDVLDDLRVVTLISPDIDPDLFRAQATAIGTLPDPFVIMSNRDDKALNLAAFLNIGRQKVGNLNEASHIEGFKIRLIDFTALEDGSHLDHLVPLTSPLAIGVLRDLINSEENGEVDLSAFDVGADGVARARPPADG
ncbi:alpha/beta hydrolase [Sulfitobacter sp. S190]|uniref:alpha/beta hydrolase n=1 Tax=Sulfitobacter sp. S190 TaxID=2867022 RepID=UPI0021A2A0BD|nr:alpha/beta fold hydrolase [Sulfitobacter sp. S190]UWR22537.1 alpha/beta fold hydrolase [Sulfitobacter sp. S190]